MASKLGPKPGPQAAAHARYAALTRDRKPDDPVLIEARQEFVFARLKARAAEIVSEFPLLTDEQCQHVAAMLKAGA